MLILTEENYFTIENRYLSNSKISDWLKDDKVYFKKKHITGEIVWQVTDPMIIGSAVDTRLTISKKAFEEQYLMVTRRSKTNKTPWRYQLNDTMAKNIDGMCKKLEATTILKDLQANFESQKIIAVPMRLGPHFNGLCGIPDWYRIEENKNDNQIVIKIVDLKTTESADPYKYHWKCINYGYYRQQAIYQMMLEKVNEKLINNREVFFESHHLVTEKDSDSIFNPYLFRLDQNRIEKEKEDLLITINEISKERDFAPVDLTWADERPIGGLDETV